MKLFLFISFLIFVSSQSGKLRMELFYNSERELLQIKVEGKEIFSHVKIYTGKELLIEFDREQIRPWDNMIEVKIPCPSTSKFIYEFTMNDGSSIQITRNKVNLSKRGTFVEIGSP